MPKKPASASFKARHNENVKSTQREKKAADQILLDEAAEDARTGLPLVEWASKHYTIRPQEPWKPLRYLADMMHVMVAPKVRRVALWKSAQLGFSQAITALHGWIVGEQDGRVVLAMPTDSEGHKAYRRFVRPMHNRVLRLKAMNDAEPDQRTTGGEHRVFKNGAESLVQGATSGDRYASFVCEVLLLDEVDRYPTNMPEGDAITLSQRAVRNSGGKVVCGSTPTSAYGPSQIVAAWTDSHVGFVYALPCPLCGELDDLEWERFHWPAEGSHQDRADGVTHECSQCGGRWTHDKLASALENGRWQEAVLETGKDFPTLKRDNPRYLTRHGTMRRGRRKVEWPEHVGFAIWGGYSIWHTWPRMVNDWLTAQGDARKIRAFVEQTLARPFGVEEGGVSDDALRDNAIPIEEVPDDYRLSVCVVDVQDKWLAAHVFLCGQEGYVMVERRDFYGDINSVDALAWVEFRRWLASKESVICRRPVRVLAVDVGFEQTWTIRNLRRVGFTGHMFAVKGRAGWGHSAKHTKTVPIDGVAANLLMLGADNLKWAVVQGYRTGKLRLWDGASAEVREELRAERLMRHDRTKRLRWEAFHDRNEALDCSAYCLGVLDVLRTPDIPSLALADAPLASGVKRRRRRMGGVVHA